MANKQAKKAAGKKPAAKAKSAATAKPVKAAAKPAKPVKAAVKPVKAAARPARPGGDGGAELAAARAESQRLADELKSARTDAQRLGDELQAAQRDLDALQRDLDAARALADKPAEAPKPVVDPSRAQLDALRPRLDAALAQAAKLEGELKSAVAERDRLRASAADLAAAGRKADDFERERTRLSGELSSVRGQLDAARRELAAYTLRCPKCGKNFVEEQYEGITIDRCTGCDAIYFDAGEVDQLLVKWQEKMAATNASPEAQQQASGWFRNLFKKKVKIVPGGGDAPPSA